MTLWREKLFVCEQLQGGEFRVRMWMRLFGEGANLAFRCGY